MSVPCDVRNSEGQSRNGFVLRSELLEKICCYFNVGFGTLFLIAGDGAFGVMGMSLIEGSEGCQFLS